MKKINTILISLFLLTTIGVLSYIIYVQIKNSTGVIPNLSKRKEDKNLKKPKTEGPNFKLKLKKGKDSTGDNSTTNSKDKSELNTKNGSISGETSNNKENTSHSEKLDSNKSSKEQAEAENKKSLNHLPNTNKNNELNTKKESNPESIEKNNDNKNTKASKKRPEAAPDSKTVVEELNKILGRKERKVTNSNGSSTDYLDLKDPLTFIIIIVAVAAIFYLLQYIMRNYQRNIQLEENTEDLEYLEENSNVLDLYNRALQAEKDGNHNLAVIYLHIGSVIFLKDNFTIQKKRKYSNNEIRRQIKKKIPELLSPFGHIARLAEIAAFSKHYLIIDDFQSAKTNYEEHFMKSRASV